MDRGGRKSQMELKAVNILKIKRLQTHSLQFVIFLIGAITTCCSCLQLVMADDIFKWIRNVSALNARRPKVDTYTLRNGTLTEHDFADTINFLLSIVEQSKQKLQL